MTCNPCTVPLSRFTGFLLLIAAVSAARLLVPHAQAQEYPPARIFFGSCLRQSLPQPVWRAVNRARPDIFIFLGDNFYAKDGDESSLRMESQAFQENDQVRRLRKRTRVLATWDDHDYGMSDGGRDNKFKDIARSIFLDVFDIPYPRAVWAREGIYDSYRYASSSGRSLEIILLDTRTFRSDVKTNPGSRRKGQGPYVPWEEPHGTILGDVQWRWLEKELARPADVKIIASSNQVLADEHGYETWGNFPHERERLLALLDTAKTSALVIISGDRHHSEISVMKRPGSAREVVDVTASSLNMPRSDGEEANRFRVGERVMEANFGALQIDWGASPPAMEARIHTVSSDGQVVLRHPISVTSAN